MREGVARIDAAFAAWHRAMRALEEAHRTGDPEARALAVRAAGNTHETVLREMRDTIDRLRINIETLGSQQGFAIEDRTDQIWVRIDENSAAIVRIEQAIVELQKAG
jgi:glycine cleavage system regulatory protein